jgi:hypothetical protein
MSLWSKIRGTIETVFQIGLGGPQVKANAGNLEARNAADAAFVIVRGATPVAANDLVTKAYADSGAVIADGGVQEIRFALTNAAAQNSVTSIPNNAIVVDAELSVTTPYSGGATITVGNAGSPALLMGTGDNNPQANGLYQVHQDTAFAGGPATVLVTIAGAPAAGAGFCIVRYVQAPQP